METILQRDDGFTPTPVISRAILAYNKGRKDHKADGIVITPSHNPPEDGGFKYNPIHGGPADTHVTKWVQDRANELLQSGNAGVKRLPFATAVKATTTHQHDFMLPYVNDLRNVIDMGVIRAAGQKLGVDPLGGASVHYWEPINDVYGIDVDVVNKKVDPTFSFMTVDHDGRIRMDCSSPYAMAGLVGLKDRYRVAFANDPDSDRHGIVTPSAGLMNPNHFLAVAINYLLQHRPQWPKSSAVGKTVVSSSMIDRVVRKLGRRLDETPVGFKWFTAGLFDGSCCFGGEESAGASFLRHDGSVWTTDKDGLIMDLLAAEITARTGKDPGEHYRDLTAVLGTSFYTRIDSPATPEQRARLQKLSAEAVKESELAGEPIKAKLTRTPGNNAPIGGLKVVTPSGWFAARPSGTEDIYKIYAESFRDQAHLGAIVRRGAADREQCTEHLGPRFSAGGRTTMSENGRANRLPLFPPDYRASGVLLHVTSLPTSYGIGDVGPAALAWIDRLSEAGQTWWQALPLGPTGYGNSPYQSLSSFAGNAMLISPDLLIEDGLLRPSDCRGRDFPATVIDYDAVIPFKQRLLETAWASFRAGSSTELHLAFDQFCDEQMHWLDEYSLFRALKARHDGACYLDWPEDLVRRDPVAMVRARRDLARQIEQIRFAQFLLFRQGARLKKHAQEMGVRLIGDLPFFVSPDSSDVWANPELFLLDERQRPRFLAGVPPDYFSSQGQLWGNPVYDWEVLGQTGYRWCIDRICALLAHVDVIRLDHFRAFAAAWHVPAGATTARSGEWVPGPGADFFTAVQKELGGLPFIAEDLGFLTADVLALRDQFQIPGTKVLQFAFDGHPDNPYLPNNYVSNAVVYTGTHDNNTSRGWYAEVTGFRKTADVALSESTSGQRRCGGSVAHAPGVVVAGRARDGSAPGSAQPGCRSPDEHSRHHCWQLALEVHRRNAL